MLRNVDIKCDFCLSLEFENMNFVDSVSVEFGWYDFFLLEGVVLSF